MQAPAARKRAGESERPIPCYARAHVCVCSRFKRWIINQRRIIKSLIFKNPERSPPRLSVRLYVEAMLSHTHTHACRAFRSSIPDSLALSLSGSFFRQLILFFLFPFRDSLFFHARESGNGGGGPRKKIYIFKRALALFLLWRASFKNYEN